MTTNEEPAILTGLLDFYSDRATAHASFLVAGIFGTYTLLLGWDGEYPQFPFAVFCLAYLALQGFNVYSFLNFGFNATVADRLKARLMGQSGYEEEIFTRIHKKNRVLSLFMKFRHAKRGLESYLFFFSVWLVALLLPFVVTIFPDYSCTITVVCVVISFLIVFSVVVSPYTRISRWFRDLKK